MALFGDNEVVALYLDPHTETTEGVRDDAKVFDTDILDTDSIAAHRCHTDEGAYLDHIGQNMVFGTMQLLYTFDGEKVGSDTADLCPHTVQQMTELLDIGFAGSVINGGGAFGQNGSHDDIGCTCHRGFVEKHIGAFQLFGGDLKDITFGNAAESGAEFLEAKEMGVEASTPYLVATGFGDDSLASSCQQWTNHQHTTTEFCAFLYELVALQVVEVQGVSLKGIGVICPFHFHADVLE